MREQDSKTFQGELRLNERMANHSSWRAGGPVDRFFVPLNTDDLLSFMKSLPADEAILWVGLGSNLLVRDGGFRGTVIYTRGRLDKMTLDRETGIQVEAGVPCARVARFASQSGLVGAEFFAGIPGTMGGALAMNAGAFGGETWNLVENVITVDRNGCFRTRLPGDYEIGYRSVELASEEWFISAHLALQKGDAPESQKQIKQLLAQRAHTQPITTPSCGSVFRNPEGDYAARLIESSGLKGKRIGGACVSEKHANFILNIDNATATDIECLMHFVADEVERRHGVVLNPEVRIVGEKGELKR